MTMGRKSAITLNIVVFSCSVGSSPAPTLTGTWNLNDGIVGDTVTVSLTEVNLSVAGSGTYQPEAGMPGTLTVTGTDSSSGVTLIISYSNGHTATLVGTFQDMNDITGTLTFSGGGSPMNVLLVRQ